jgi:hypothetical protein
VGWGRGTALVSWGSLPVRVRVRAPGLGSALPQLRPGPADSSPSARSMLGRIQAQAFSFDQTFQPYQKDDFVMVGIGERGRGGRSFGCSWEHSMTCS